MQIPVFFGRVKKKEKETSNAVHKISGCASAVGKKKFLFLHILSRFFPSFLFVCHDFVVSSEHQLLRVHLLLDATS